jgi:hypothetical protein
MEEPPFDKLTALSEVEGQSFKDKTLRYPTRSASRRGTGANERGARNGEPMQPRRAWRETG